VRLRVVSPSLLALAAAVALFAALVTEQTDMQVAASRAGRQRRFHVCQYPFNYLEPLPDIEVATVKRPTGSQVQEVWSEMLALWDEGTEEERQEIAAAFVVRVDVKEKDRASMELLPMPEGYGLKFVTRSQLGAGAEVIAINPPLLTTHTFPPIELDYDIIKPRRVMRRRVVMVTHGATG